MKIKIFLTSIVFLTVSLASCSEDVLDRINEEKNGAVDMTAKNLLPSILARTAFQTTGTDYAWYASLFVEHNVGTWGQQASADKRIAMNDNSMFNNNWVSSYSIVNTCRIIQSKCQYGGEEFPNFTVYGISEVIEAYNVGVLVDLFGDVPYTESVSGAANLHPKFDNANTIYPKLQIKLDSAIVHLTKSGNSPGAKDYIYGGSSSAWLKAAWSLKARYFMRLSNVDAQAATKALTCMSKSFTSGADALVFDKYDANSAIAENPWFQFFNDRSGLSSSKTLYDIMKLRNDPRISVYFDMTSGTKWAENGIAEENQGGLYYVSNFTQVADAKTPIMSYHELCFIKAEAEFLTNTSTWKSSLQKAIQESFVYNGLTVAVADAYYNVNVAPKLTVGNEVNEIITQKWISLYEAESIEAYNDYRRTGIPTMNNPKNLIASGGYIRRLPYALSDVSSNGSNVPQVNIFKDKLFWAK